jgi:hypothetical protein
VVTEVDFGARAKTQGHGSGFGDIGLGLAKGLLHERNWWPDLIGRVTWDTDSGETSDEGFSLGSGFNELQGSLIMVKRQDPLVFIGSASYATTFEKDDINRATRSASRSGRCWQPVLRPRCALFSIRHSSTSWRLVIEPSADPIR